MGKIHTMKYEVEILYFFFLIFEIWCVFNTYSTSQFRLATFQNQ